MIKRSVLLILAVFSFFGPLVTADAFLKFPLRRARTANWSGQIHSDTTWQDKIVVTADVVVMPGARLSILPGTTVVFEKSKSTKIDPFYFSTETELIVRGQLIARGTENQPITFSPREPEKNEIGWAGIFLDAPQRENSLLSHCRIEQAEYGIYVFAGRPFITNNRILACRYGIISQLQAAPLITENTLSSLEVGISCLPSSFPKIRGNSFDNCEEEAIYVAAGSYPIITDNNRFTNNRYDIRWMGGGQ